MVPRLCCATEFATEPAIEPWSKGSVIPRVAGYCCVCRSVGGGGICVVGGNDVS